MTIRDSYLGQAWLVIVMALVVGAALAGLHATLNERIQANAEAEALSGVPGLVSGADAVQSARTRPEEIAVARPDGTRAVYKVYRALDKDGRQVGWAVKAAGEGFAGTIELLLGLDAQADTLVGLVVLAQKETPNLGERIKQDEFRGRLAGKKTDAPLIVVKGPPKAQNQVQAISGATISSRSVCAIVNAAVADLRAELKARARKDQTAP
jgi:electron transport complex protein RnfG